MKDILEIIEELRQVVLDTLCEPERFCNPGDIFEITTEPIKVQVIIGRCDKSNTYRLICLHNGNRWNIKKAINGKNGILKSELFGPENSYVYLGRLDDPYKNLNYRL